MHVLAVLCKRLCLAATDLQRRDHVTPVHCRPSGLLLHASRQQLTPSAQLEVSLAGKAAMAKNMLQGVDQQTQSLPSSTLQTSCLKHEAQASSRWLLTPGSHCRQGRSGQAPAAAPGRSAFARLPAL